MWVYQKEGERVASPALLLSGPALGILISLGNDYTRLDTKMKKVGLIKRKQTESEYLLQYYEASCVIY